MSIVISTDVFCDGVDCIDWVQGVTGTRAWHSAARAEAKRHGWVHIKGQDLCPRCSPVGQAKKAMIKKLEEGR